MRGTGITGRGVRRAARRMGIVGLAVLATATAGVAGDEDPARPPRKPPTAEGEGAVRPARKPGLSVVEGQLESIDTGREDAPAQALVIRVDKRVYELHADGGATALAKLVGRMVSARGEFGAEAGGRRVLQVAKDGVQKQQPRAVRGRVTRRSGKAPKGRSELLLVAPDRSYGVSQRDAKRFKPFVDQHVEARTLVVAGPEDAWLSGVKSVTRFLAPGERDPKTKGEAFAGAWKGVITVTTVPKGVPGARPGDLELSFQADEKLQTATGRLTNAYDVKSIDVRKFNRRKRTATFDVNYSFGQGTYAVRMTGTFAADWKSLAGDWKSSFLGSGTFRVAVDS